MDSLDKPGHDALKLVPDSDDQQLTRQESCIFFE
jgi:hypothetical protein